jgi:sulfur carrier protein ThiS
MSHGCVHGPMRVRVQMAKGDDVIELSDSSTPAAVLDLLRLLPDAHIVLRGRVPIPIDEPLVDGDSIKIIKVASGG